MALSVAFAVHIGGVDRVIDQGAGPFEDHTSGEPLRHSTFYHCLVESGDLKPAPRGVTKVEVSFTMDADGILEITAAEIGTGRAASVQIEATSGLTAEEIERLGQRLAT